ncbi:MAG: hypothetical protein HGA90_06935, partial [Alphaproteobacteria bacterium]|nr:hypothetical protein [Alphaproteobacteria bacterium]
PYAEKGVLDLPTLRSSFDAEAAAVTAALRKAGATTWKDRVAAELQGLLSVRRLNPTGNEEKGLAAIADDLEHHRLAAALDKITSLPDEAQNILKDWRLKAEKRRTLDAGLDRLATLLVLPAQAKDETAGEGREP